MSCDCKFELLLEMTEHLANTGNKSKTKSFQIPAGERRQNFFGLNFAHSKTTTPKIDHSSFRWIYYSTTGLQISFTRLDFALISSKPYCLVVHTMICLRLRLRLRHLSAYPD